jgi:hypothetical protein
MGLLPYPLYVRVYSTHTQVLLLLSFTLGFDDRGKRERRGVCE